MKLINNLKLIAPLLFLSFGLASCSDDKSPKVVTPWEIQAPYFKIYDNTTDEASKSQSLNRINLDSESINLSTTDELVFEQNLANAKLKFETLCQTTNDKVFKTTGQTALLKENKIYGFLPEAVLLLIPQELKSTTCAVRFVAVSANGSTHDFGQDINFNLVGENRDLLMKLEDENEPEENSQWEGVSLITLQRARYNFLNRQDTTSFSLKCADFESTAREPQTLLDLIDNAPLPDGPAKDQLCRVLATHKNGSTQISKLFNLRLFDTKNFVESISPEPKVHSLQMSNSHINAEVHLNQIALFNRTKYPVYFSTQNLTLKVDTFFRKSRTTSVKKGQLNIAVKARTNPTIKNAGDRTIFVLAPGQKILVAYTIVIPFFDGSASVSILTKTPTLDVLDKKSWSDSSENVVTSLPLMSQPIVKLALKPPRR